MNCDMGGAMVAPAFEGGNGNVDAWEDGRTGGACVDCDEEGLHEDNLLLTGERNKDDCTGCESDAGGGGDWRDCGNDEVARLVS